LPTRGENDSFFLIAFQFQRSRSLHTPNGNKDEQTYQTTG